MIFIKKAILFFVFIVIVLFWSVFLIPQTKTKLIETKYLQPTPTINFYQEDLYAQCRGLSSYNELMRENESLKISENFKKEYKLILDSIESDKILLNLPDFECPELR